MSDTPRRNKPRTYSSTQAEAVLVRAKYVKYPDDFKERAIEAAKELLTAVEETAKAAQYDVIQTDNGLSVAMLAAKTTAQTTAVLVRADARDGLLFEYGTPAKIQATDITYDPVKNRFVGTVDAGDRSKSGPNTHDGESESSSDRGSKRRRNALTVAAEALVGVLK